MSRIGILDDRQDLVDTLIIHMEEHLDLEHWELVKVPMLPSSDEVVRWLVEEKISVLIIDQTLTDVAPVDYQGHMVVQKVRQHMPDLPVYMISAYVPTPDVQANLGAMEEVVSRTDFVDGIGVFVERMVRAGDSFVRRNQDALERLASLSAKGAAEELNDQERAELSAIQTSLNIADVLGTRKEILPLIEAQVAELSALRAKAEALLAKNR